MQCYEESIEDCAAALELDNSCLDAMVQGGKCYMELQEWDKAVRTPCTSVAYPYLKCGSVFEMRIQIQGIKFNKKRGNNGFEIYKVCSNF